MHMPKLTARLLAPCTPAYSTHYSLSQPDVAPGEWNVQEGCIKIIPHFSAKIA